MRYRHLRRTVIAVLATVAFILLIAVLLRAALEAAPTRRYAIRKLERLASHYGAELTIGDLHWSLLPPGIRLEEVALRSTGLRAEAASVRLDLARLRLTSRTVELDTVAVRGLRLSVEELPQRSERKPARFKVRVRRLILEDVEVVGADLPGKIDLDLDGVRGAWFTENGVARGYAQVARAQLEAGRLRPVDFAIDARFVLDDDGLNLSNFRASAEGLEAGGSGRASAKGISLDFTGTIDLGWLAATVRTGDLLDGRVDFSGTLDTTAEELIRADIRSPHLEVAGLPVDDLVGTMAIHGKGLSAKLERARFHGGVVRGEYRLAEIGGDFPHDVRLEGTGVRVPALLSDIGIDTAGLQATMDVNLEGAWNGSSLGKGAGHASVALSGSSPGVPVTGPLDVRLEGDGLLRFDAPNLQIGGSRAHWQGALSLGTWKTTWAIAVEPAVVEEIVPLVNTWVGSTILPPELSGRGKLQVNLDGPFTDLVVNGRVDIGDLTLPPVRLDRLVSEFTVQESLLQLGSTRFQVADGFGEVDGGISWGEAAGDEQLDLNLRANHIPVASVASWVDLDGWVDGGSLSAVGRLRGPIALPRGSWALGLDDLRLMGLELGDASATLELADAKLACHDLRCDRGLIADLWWKVTEGDVGGNLSWPAMPLDVLGEAVTRLAGDQADIQLEFRLPPGRRLVGEMKAVSEQARLDVLSEDDTVTVDASVRDEARAQARLAREPDGSLHGNGHLDLSSAQGLLAHLAPDLGVPLTGTAQVDFQVDWGKDEPWPSVSGRLEEVELALQDHPVSLIEPADFQLSSAGFVVPGLRLRARDDEMFVRWKVDSEGGLTGNLSGTIDALLLRFLLPEWEAAGRATGVVEFLGTVSDPKFEGVAEIDRGSFRIPGTRTVLSQVSGTAVLSSGEVGLEGVDFRIMQGRSSCNGRIWQRNGSAFLNLAGQARSLRFAVLPGLEARLSGPWQLVGPVDNLELSGNIALDRVSLKTKDDVASILLAWLGRASGPPGAEGGLRLNLHVSSEETIQLTNPFVRLTGSASFDVSGTSNRPGLVGRMEFQEGGEVTFLGNRYEIERGNLTFTDPESIDPFVDLQASTWVQEYQITVHLTGTLERFVPTVVSTPPLSAPDIYSLLGVGYRDEGLGSGAVGLGLASSILSQQLTAALSHQAQLVIPVDQVRVDPFSADSTGNPTARLSVVKQLTPFWTVVLQTTLAGEREQLVISRWYLAPGLFVEAAQHEDGSYSLDLKLRRPY